MASVCGYYCLRCKITLKTEKGWLNHLLSPGHQAEAGTDLVSWNWQRVLVAFGKFSVATETVLGSFVGRDGRSNLSGFLWNEKRPRIGLLLLENREQVYEILNGLDEESKMRIGTYQVLQLRKATDYLDMEWEQLIAQHFREELSPEFKTEGLKTEADDENLPSSKRRKLVNYPSDESSVDSEELKQDGEEASVKIEPDMLVLAPLNLSSQFDFICREMETGDAAYSKALIMMERFQRVLTPYYNRCQLFMFRHWYLKLRAQGADELLLYVDAEGSLRDVRGGEISKGGQHGDSYKIRLFTTSEARDILAGLKSVKPSQSGLEFGNDKVLHFKDIVTKTKFVLVADRRFAVEAQTCRLLKYLLDFDQRAKPFLTLIFYWAEQNQVKIRGSSMPNHSSYAFAPDPAGLEWMVILFLCQRGILPTPRQILESGNNDCNLKYALGPKRSEQIDIGFRMVKKFAKKWKTAHRAYCPDVNSDLFVLHLVVLCKEFFEFYGELRSNSLNWVLNTRDAELLRREDVLEVEQRTVNSRKWTSLTKNELTRIRYSKGKPGPGTVQQNDLTNRRLTILHPLILEWTIPCDEDNFFGKICGEMQASANIIELGMPLLDGNQDQQTTLLSLFRKVTPEEVRPFCSSKKVEAG